MILKGSQRAGAKQLSTHLVNTRDNDHVTVLEVRGFIARDLHGALAEAYAISKGTKCQQFMFSLSLNPPMQAIAGEDDFRKAADKAEKKLGLEGQPRAIVMHEKEGRRYAHVVWSRIDPETMKAINLSYFKQRPNELARELYLEHEWTLPGGLRRDGGKSPLNFTLAVECGPAPVVDLLDEVGKVLGYVVESLEGHRIDRFDLQRLHEALGFGVVIRIASAAHRADQIVVDQKLPAALGGILRAAIGMVNAARWRLSAINGSLQGGDG